MRHLALKMNILHFDSQSGPRPPESHQRKACVSLDLDLDTLGDFLM